MLDKAGQIAPYLAVAVLGYLAYTVMEAAALPPPPGKDAPGLTKRMLHPELVTPKGHASPAGRDPFEVAWARYLNKMGADSPAPPKEPDAEGEDEWEAYLGVEPAAPAKTVTAGPPSPAETPKPAGAKDAAVKPAATKDPTPKAAAAPQGPPALGGVIVSGRSRLAVLNGDVYQVGEHVKAADPDRRWLVETIEADRVVLRLGDMEQTLKLPQ
jgi:hypothetical protein